MLLRVLVAVLICANSGLFGQSSSETDLERLRFLADSFRIEEERAMERVREWCDVHQIPQTLQQNGRMISVVDVIEGRPLFQADANVQAAQTSRASLLHPGGSSGLGLTGTGMTIGMWEGQSAATQHVEFAAASGGSRIQTMDGSAPSTHGSHVAGTLIASGVNAAAKGMAPNASVRSYDWDFELSEMATEAASGLLISNHSYAYLAGWEAYGSANYWFGWDYLSPTEDYLFGFYYSQTRAWDLIAEAAPYYLIVKAAGNDRGENLNGPHYFWDGSAYSLSNAVRDADGGTDGFDSMLPRGNAKNILTVGAVNDVTNYTNPSDVQLYSGSCWGPTDDGRIKPDLVANGVGLFSCSNSTSGYTTLTGTSMSTPNASGSLLLVQEHSMGVRGAYLRAATLKGLAIHTAREAGPAPGPDYQHGWGLIDVYRAATTLDSAQLGKALVLEGVLHQPDTTYYTLEVPPASSGNIQPLVATLCWTDPVGAPAGYILNDTTPRLVHDLDIRLHTPTGTIELPWTLDPANPSNPAYKGDNHRDNVEKIELANPSPGTYLLEIRHKNQLMAHQPYSLVVTGAHPAPHAGFTINSRNPCPGDTVLLKPFASLPIAAQNQWEITPATGWSFVNGTSANTDSAWIVFSAAGTFSATRIATIGNASDTLTQPHAIQVGGASLPYQTSFTTLAERTQWSAPTVGGGPSGNQGWYFDTDNGARLRVNNYNTLDSDGAVIVGPLLDLSGLGTAELSFKYGYFTQPMAASDTLEVGLVLACGTQDTAISSFYGPVGSWALDTSSFDFVPYTAGDWCDSSGTGVCATVNLSGFAGQSGIRIYLKNRSAGNNNLHIDEIRVDGVAALVLSTSASDVGCAGDSDGAAFATVSGGQAPYSVVWSTSDTGLAVSGLSAGLYGVTVSDGSGQVLVGSATVGAPAPLSATSLGTGPSSWGSADGSAWVDVFGGTPPYIVSWSTGATADSLSGLTAGVYSFTVFDANGCSDTGSIALQNPPPPALLASDSSVPVSCFGLSDGALTLTPSSGIPPYSISWSNGASTFTISGLPAGTWTYVLSDAAGQSVNGSVVVTQPDSLTISLDGGLVQGYIAASGTGGVPPYSVDWATGGATGDTLFPSAGGLYTATLTDANGCVAVASADFPLGIQSRERLLFEVYPNPGTDGLTLQAMENLEEVRVLDVSGRCIQMLNFIPSSEERKINASSWKAGTYFICAKTASGWGAVRWVKLL